MWTRRATLNDLPFCLSADTLAGVVVDRTRYFATAIVDGGCLLAGRSQGPEGIVVSAPSFFSRPFISLLFVAETSRRCGLASRLMDAVEANYIGEQIFTSTNQSNLPLQILLQRRVYLSAGVVLHLDPGDPELIFVKKL